MKEILLIAKHDAQCSEWFSYLTKKIPPTIINVEREPLDIDILINDYHVIIRPKSENCYRGRRPDYHYAYGREANSHLLSIGSKRLKSLDDVIDIAKGDCYEL